MSRRLLALSLFFLATLVVAQDGEKKDDDKKDDKLVSGPQAGAVLPGPFPIYNVNGPRKGRYHCVVLDFAHDPAVVAFVREPEEGKDEAVAALIKKLDEAIARHDEAYLRASVIFLSPAARSSATEKKIEDPKLLVAEAVAREALLTRMQARAAKLRNADDAKKPDDKKPDDKEPDEKKPADKNPVDDKATVILAIAVPEGPKDYNLSPKAGVTVLFYRKLKMIENFTFEADTMTVEDVDLILKKVDKHFTDAKKSPANPKKK